VDNGEENLTTVKWENFNTNSFYYKWPQNSIKADTKIVIGSGQILIIFAGGRIEGVFENQGTYTVLTQIMPGLQSYSGYFANGNNTEMPCEVYLFNKKVFLVNWETRQKLIITVPEVPSGVAVVAKGEFFLEFEDYLNFINRIAGLNDSYTTENFSDVILKDVGQRIKSAIMEARIDTNINEFIKLRLDASGLDSMLEGEYKRRFEHQGLNMYGFKITSFAFPSDIFLLANQPVSKYVLSEMKLRKIKEDPPEFAVNMYMEEDTAEEIAAEETVLEEAVAEEAVIEEIVTEEEEAGEIAAEEAEAGDVAAEEAVIEEIVTEEEEAAVEIQPEPAQPEPLPEEPQIKQPTQPEPLPDEPPKPQEAEASQAEKVLKPRMLIPPKQPRSDVSRGDFLCIKCRKMVNAAICPFCGEQTV
jgi:membrane protease subunit (stomatin/prohibitin family)